MFEKGPARADAGRRANDLLDEGRRRFLREACGFDDARLVTYIDGGVTPENVLIVGACPYSSTYSSSRFIPKGAYTDTQIHR